MLILTRHPGETLIIRPPPANGFRLQRWVSKATRFGSVSRHRPISDRGAVIAHGNVIRLLWTQSSRSQNREADLRGDAFKGAHVVTLGSVSLLPNT
jgi:hypothetical protein